MLGKGFGKRQPAFNIIDHIAQGVLQYARLALASQNPEAAKDRKAGVLKCGKLAGECTKLLWLDLAEGEGLLFALLFLLGLGLGLGFLANRRHKEAALTDQLLCFLLRGGFNRVLDRLAGLVHRFVLEGRHCSEPQRAVVVRVVAAVNPAH